MGLSQAFELLPQQGIFRVRTVGILIGDTLGDAAHMPQQLPVAGDIGNLQVKGYAALLRPDEGRLVQVVPLGEDAPW